MKLAVIKLGSRISHGGRDTSGGNYEAKHIIDMLVRGGANVTAYTKILSKDIIPNKYNVLNIEDTYEQLNDKEYDALVVINGNTNFFGGAESRDQILNYWMINNFKGKVFYIYCDPSLSLKQLWGSISGKEWASNWKQEDIEIVRKDIIYISQPYDLDEVRSIIDKSKVYVSEIIHYPFEKFPCLDEMLPLKKNPSCDLSYGGTMRGNRRIKKMVQFYYGYPDNIKVEMFGKMNPEDLKIAAEKYFEPDLREPIFGKAVDATEYLEKSNDSLSHVVIGDVWYEGKDMPQRCYQSIWTSVITFIDIELDPKMRVFGSSDFCKKFNYVSNRKDVEKRLNAVKEHPELRAKIIEEQLLAIDFDEDKFCKDFYNIILENKNNTPITHEIKYVDTDKKIKSTPTNKPVNDKPLNSIEGLFG